jgi:hypothetical protein
MKMQDKTPSPAEVAEIRSALRRLRKRIAQLQAPKLSDVDSLLDVAEAELDRMAEADADRSP